MKLATTRELYAYWNEIRRERLAPERADIDPTAIRGLLGHTFVLETDRAGRFPFRLSGTRLNALFMRELRGSSFLGLWQSAERRQIAELLLSVLDDVMPLIIGAGAAPLGHVAVDLELLLLPLRHRGKTHARILGSLTPSRQSSWFGLIAAEALMLRSVRVLKPGADTFAPLLATANSPAANDGAIRPSVTRRLHLTVFPGGR
jgi:hypothetical protein